MEKPWKWSSLRLSIHIGSKSSTVSNIFSSDCSTFRRRDRCFVVSEEACVPDLSKCVTTVFFSTRFLVVIKRSIFCNPCKQRIPNWVCSRPKPTVASSYHGFGLRDGVKSASWNSPGLCFFAFVDGLSRLELP